MKPKSRAASNDAGTPKPDRLSRQLGILARRLPGMIAKAAAGYERLAAWELAEDVKSIAAHQAALRAALAHIEALLDLAQRLNGEGTGRSGQDPGTLLEQLFQEATAAVAMLPEEPQE